MISKAVAEHSLLKLIKTRTSLSYLNPLPCVRRQNMSSEENTVELGRLARPVF